MMACLRHIFQEAHCYALATCIIVTKISSSTFYCKNSSLYRWLYSTYLWRHRNDRWEERRIEFLVINPPTRTDIYLTLFLDTVADPDLVRSVPFFQIKNRNFHRGFYLDLAPDPTYYRRTFGGILKGLCHQIRIIWKWYCCKGLGMDMRRLIFKNF
jgi:hypothetical protein